MQSTSTVRTGSGGNRKERSARKEARQQLSLYSDPPNEEISLDEFEEFALDRLQVLRTIEMLNARGIHGEEYKKKMNEVTNRFLRMHSYGESANQDARKDKISHFILRLAYCKSEDLRRWFLAHESALFRFRLERLAPDDARRFMEDHGLAYATLGPEEKEALWPELQQCAAFALPADPARAVYYKVPFAEALRLVAGREVLVRGGHALVPMERLVAILQARFRAGLSRHLARASAAFAHVCADPRLAPLVRNLSVQYTGQDYGAQAGAAPGLVTPDKLDMLANRSMPLCMSQMHRAVQRDHHLKHTGRIQLGLFLKGAGLSLEDALVWWQRAFTKGMSVDQFNKKGYPYEIRYNYGKEGKRTNYTPYSCTKLIVGDQPQVGQTHGCPFKTYGETQLSALLGQLRVDGAAKDDIMAQKKAGHFQLACQRHFEALHPPKETGAFVNTDGVGNHPNGWFEASLTYHGELGGDSNTAAAGGAGGDQEEAGGGAEGSQSLSPQQKQGKEGASSAVTTPMQA